MAENHHKKRAIRVAIMGHRGIPCRYGGFETFAEQAALRFVRMGYDVRVYNRSHNGDYRRPRYKGAKMIYLPTVRNKYCDTWVHSLLCVLHAMIFRVDVILMVNVGNAPFTLLPRLVGTPVVLNVDGLEWQRRKWGRWARWYFLLCEKMALVFPNTIVTDAQAIYDYYKQRYGKNSVMIPYGAEVKRKSNLKVLKKYGLTAGRYFLYVSRFEPENNALEVREAFEDVHTNMPLVMVGDAPYAQEYVKSVRDTNDERIRFTGFVFGNDYKVLQQNAYAFIQATEVGGTHPALIEAMGYGNCVIVLNTPSNSEVAGNACMLFDQEEGDMQDLVRKLELVADNPSIVKYYRTKAQERIREMYAWDAVIIQYSELFLSLLSKKMVNRIRATVSEVAHKSF
ncbi:MAG TPA: DUF1972 domain-containing protein [Patescibacteria group bacterium]|nr:DUF1972 domain-containing protein [Patescibacteria group bacterium]